MADKLMKAFARKVADYFSDKPIPPYLDADLELRDGARKILGLSPVRSWKEGDPHEAYEGHKLRCPNCKWEMVAEELP